MSTLTSSSTDAQVNSAFDDNASYIEDQSATKAGAFITACTFLIRRLKSAGAQGASSFSYSIAELAKLRMDAVDWEKNNNTTDYKRRTQADVSSFRD